MADEELIPKLGEVSYVWITKDDAAKSVHKEAIKLAQISVVWVRGLQRADGTKQKNSISAKSLHRMLTVKLDEISEQVSMARGPRFFLLYLNGSRPQIRGENAIEDIGKLLSGRGKRR